MGSGVVVFGSSSSAFPGHKQGARLEVDQPGHESELLWDAGAARHRAKDSPVESLWQPYPDVF